MKRLRERQVSLRMALTMCAAAGAITAVICLISTGWNTNEVGKSCARLTGWCRTSTLVSWMRTMLRITLRQATLPVWETSGRRIFRRKTTKPTA